MSTNKDRLSFAQQKEFREPFVIYTEICVERTVFSHKKPRLGRQISQLECIFIFINRLT